MNPLVELVRTCRAASALHVRLRFTEEIIVRVGPLLQEYVARRCPEELAEDVLQEALIAISTAVCQFRGQSDRQFWQWCYRVTSRTIANRLRKRDARPMLSLDVEEIRRAVEASATEATISLADRLDLEQALDLLRQSRAPCAALLTWHFIVGLDYAELAEHLHLNRDTVRMRIQRCLTLVRQLVAELL